MAETKNIFTASVAAKAHQHAHAFTRAKGHRTINDKTSLSTSMATNLAGRSY